MDKEKVTAKELNEKDLEQASSGGYYGPSDTVCTDPNNDCKNLRNICATRSTGRCPNNYSKTE